MRFELKTLIDITETGARRGEDSFKYNQQQNYITLYQTLALRANPIVKRTPVSEKCNISNFGFGSKYRGVHRVWTFVFEFEGEEQHSVEMMREDVNLVPVITRLDETAKLETGAFLTKDPQNLNIIFQQIDV